MEGEDEEEGEEEMNDEGDEELLEEGDKEVEGFGFPYEGISEGMDDEEPEDEEQDEDEMVEETMINKMKKTFGLGAEKEGMQNLGPCPYNDESMCGKYDIYGTSYKGKFRLWCSISRIIKLKGSPLLESKTKKFIKYKR